MNRVEAGKLGGIASSIKWQKIYNEKPKQCIECNKIFRWEERHKKFCGPSCSSKHNRRNGIGGRAAKYFCKICQNPTHHKTKIYCSRKCYYVGVKQKRIERFNNGEINDPRTLRTILMNQRNGCWDCGNTTWKNVEIPLELEHKDGNYKNNHPNNLEMLCPNCHALTPTFKNKNKGNGRAIRRKRYNEEKSY